MVVSDSTREYRQFTKPAELHKAINTLRGLVAGISCSGGVSAEEMQEIVHWCTLHSHLRDRHPFSELLPVIEHSMLDGFIDAEEQKDILWLCNNFIDEGKYYDVVTSSIQFLSGLVHGIMGDGVLSDKEIKLLRLWLESNDFLQGTYPFDELCSLISVSLEDGSISNDERNRLLAFMSNLVEFKDSYNLSEIEFAKLRKQYSVSGICATNPIIDFEGKTFCFTGESYRAKRSEIEHKVEELGGIFKNTVSKKIDYLVVGNAGNPCWAYSCYGRKIEEAMDLRKSGSKIQIVNESDFWIAVDNSQIDMVSSVSESCNSNERLAFNLIYPHLSDILYDAPMESNILVFREISNCSSVYFLNAGTIFFQVRLRKVARYLNLPEECAGYLPDGIIGKKTSSAKGMIRVPLSVPEDILYYIPTLRSLLSSLTIRNLSFGCCSQYEACSDAKGCIHPDPVFSLGCQYRRNLSEGKIFYGKNKNI